MLTLKLKINGTTDVHINPHALLPKKFSTISSLNQTFLMIYIENLNYDIMLSD